MSKIEELKHGNTAEYRAWSDMKKRCNNPNNKRYKNYGGRGIKVCDRWINSFSNFLQDMGLRPNNKYSLDRIDNNKGYEPSNCRWANSYQQVRNKTANRVITYNNESLCCKDFADKFNLKPNTLLRRLYYGWSIEKALTTPVKTKDLK